MTHSYSNAADDVVVVVISILLLGILFCLRQSSTNVQKEKENQTHNDARGVYLFSRNNDYFDLFMCLDIFLKVQEKSMNIYTFQKYFFEEYEEHRI